MEQQLACVLNTLERHLELAGQERDIPSQLLYCKCINQIRSVLFELQQNGGLREYDTEPVIQVFG